MPTDKNLTKEQLLERIVKLRLKLKEEKELREFMHADNKQLADINTKLQNELAKFKSSVKPQFKSQRQISIKN